MSTSTDSSSDRNPVEALADDFLRRQRGGERPTLEEYCRRHPELADEIREVFPVLIRMEDMRSDGPDESTGGMAVHTATRLERLGDYRILREIGRGGMGVVYEAEQESLGRRVALKILPDAALADAKQVLRFEREARAAARLHHTNIVPVFGVGQDDGHHYYVMQFIPGMGLDAVLEELRRLRRGRPPSGRAPSRGPVSAIAVAEAIVSGRFSPTDPDITDPVPNGVAVTAAVPIDYPPDTAPPTVSLPGASADSLARSDPDRTFFRSVARIGLQVAEALEYANRQGILHRDVKPSNLLLDPKGNVWVADFGLAKAADTEDITHSGDIIGTVRYMAPERFAGKCDARSDVYALGLTLYELLALRPAFEASDRHELMRRVMSEQPERLRGLVPNIPRDLETIIQKAIDRDPAQRYVTAAALAEDLQRFLDDKPIKARRVNAAEQAWRWARRNPAVASLAVGLMLALVAGLAGVTWQWHKAVANLSVAETANRKAQARFDLAMEAVRAFTNGASEDVLLREKQLAGLRTKLLQGSLFFYDRLAASMEGETDRASRRALARAVYDAGELNGRIGRRGQALEAHRKALALREVLAKQAPGDFESRREVGQSELAVGETLAAMGRHAEARQALARSRSVAEELARERPDDSAARVLLAAGLLAEGQSLIGELRLVDAEPFLAQALVTYDRLIRDGSSADPADAPEPYLRGRAMCSYTLGRWWGENRPSVETLAALERATADFEALTRRFPGDVDLWLALADCHTWTANYFNLNVDKQSDRARRNFRQAKAIYERLAREKPTVTKIRSAWTSCLTANVTGIRPGATREELQEFLRDMELAHTLSRELVAADPDVPMHTAELGKSLEWLGEALAFVGRRDEGIARLRESFELLEKTDFTRSSYLFQRGGIARNKAAFGLAVHLSLAGRASEALKILRKGIALDEAYTGPRESYWFGTSIAECYLLRSYLAFGAGLKVEAAEAVEHAAALYERMTDRIPAVIWYRAGLHLLWYMQGRQAAPGRHAEPPGRPENVTQALALLRRAADRGFVELTYTRAFYGPVIGHLPEFQRLMMDLQFPADPFRPEPGSKDDEPASDARGHKP
jgi:eukaryotic-like serine/threonine-protein kinase